MHQTHQADQKMNTDGQKTKFFKFSEADRMRSGAVRRRQNRLYINKLPKAQMGKEIVPSKYAAKGNSSLGSPSGNRAANGLQEGQMTSVDMEVAAW